MPRFSHTHRRLTRAMGKAMHDYAMIADGDRIALGLSGGKDSWALLGLLAQLQNRAPIDYELFPIFIDPGFEGGPGPVIARHAQTMGFEVHIEKTDDGLVAHSKTNTENPCFLCARRRRQRLFEIAHRKGCRKLALAHNKDDVIETLFLNMCYAGELSTMLPCQPFFGGEITVIRPLAYADEDLLVQFAGEMAWPVKANPCPSAGKTKRAEIKTMLNRLYAGNKKVKGNIFRALRHVKPEYLLRP